MNTFNASVRKSLLNYNVTATATIIIAVAIVTIVVAVIAPLLSLLLPLLLLIEAFFEHLVCLSLIRI